MLEATIHGPRGKKQRPSTTRLINGRQHHKCIGLGPEQHPPIFPNHGGPRTERLISE